MCLTNVPNQNTLVGMTDLNTTKCQSHILIENGPCRSAAITGWLGEIIFYVCLSLKNVKKFCMCVPPATELKLLYCTHTVYLCSSQEFYIKFNLLKPSVSCTYHQV
jgi:hypothetical protein